MPKPKESKIKVVRALCLKILKAIFILTIPSYFLWSGLIYTGAAVAIVILKPSLKTFLCDVYVAPDKCDVCQSTLLMCKKDFCYRNAMNVTILTQASTTKGDYYSSFSKASLDSGCNNVIKDSKDPVDAIRRMYNAYSGLTSSDSECIAFHCGVLDIALTHKDLVAAIQSTATTGCSNVEQSKQANRANDCVCSSLWTEMYKADDNGVTMASQYQTICGAPMPQTTVTTTTTSNLTAPASSRLLGDSVLTQGQSRALQATTAEPSSAPSRALATTAAAKASGASNDDLKEYTVGEWTQCTCYQACVQGIMTRTVDCLSANCKDPKPATSAKCECHHCANCSVLFNTTIFFLSFIIQGAVALLVWLALVYMGSVDEASLVRLSWFQWFLGFFVKQLPPFARLLILANLGQSIMMLVQTWVPESVLAWEPDCNDVPQMRFMSIFLAAIMFVLLLIGRVTRVFNRMMPYLFSPSRATSPAPIRLWSKLQGLLGP